MKAAGVLAILLIAAAAEAAVTVRVADRAAASGAAVRLADVARIEGGGPDEARMADVVVALPAEGTREASVTAADIREALGAAGFNLAEVSISGAATSTVTLEAAGPARSEMAAAVNAFIAGVRPSKRFRLSGLRADFAPAQGMKPVVVAASPKDLSGMVRFDVADEASISTVAGHVYATLAPAAPALVAAKRIEKGHVVGPDDVEVKYIGEAESAEAIGQMSGAVGRRAAYTVEQGKVISEWHLARTAAVERGDEVTLEISSGGLAVRVKTSALESAAEGDVARLRRAGTRDEYLARITGPGTAVLAGEKK